MCVGEGWGLGSGAFYTPEKTGTIPEGYTGPAALVKPQGWGNGTWGWGGGGAHDRDKEGRCSLKPVTRAC